MFGYTLSPISSANVNANTNVKFADVSEGTGPSESPSTVQEDSSWFKPISSNNPFSRPKDSGYVDTQKMSQVVPTISRTNSSLSGFTELPAVANQTTPHSIASSRRPSGCSERSRIEIASGARHVLEGRMMLSTRLGQRLWNIRWPVNLCFGLLQLAIITNHVRAAIVTVTESVLNSEGHHAEVMHFWEPFVIVCILLATACNWLLLHQVHKALLKIAMKSLDPYIVAISMVRLWASFAYSRYLLTEVSGDSTIFEDALLFILFVQLMWMFISLEAAVLQGYFKFWTVLCSMCCCAFIWCNGMVSPVNWDPEASVSMEGMAPMTPRNQFCSAILVVVVIMAKGSWNLFRGHDFMFINTHFSLTRDTILELFTEVDLDGDGLVSFQDWRVSLTRAGIVGVVQRESYCMLDGSAEDSVTLSGFRNAFTEQLRTHPNISGLKRLKHFCKGIARLRYDIEPVPDMLKMVLRQWEWVKLERMGKTFMKHLMQNEMIGSLFKSRSLEAHALVFIGMLSSVMSWLREGRFLILTQKLEALGERHTGMGIKGSMVATFQVALFVTLEGQLQDKMVAHRRAWAFIWLHFVILPFTRGLIKNSGFDIANTSTLAKDSFKELCSIPKFMAEVEMRLLELSDHTAKLAKASSNPQLNTKYTPLTVSSTALWTAKQPRTGNPYFVDFLAAAVQTAPLASSSHGCSARANYAQKESLFWRIHADVGPMELVFLEKAFMETLQERSGSLSSHTADVWMHLFHSDLMESRLMLPFVNIGLELEELLLQIESNHEVSNLSEKEFTELFERVVGLPADMSSNLYRLMTENSPDGNVSWQRLQRSVVNQAMLDPCGTLKDALVALCTAEDMTEERSTDLCVVKSFTPLDAPSLAGPASG